MWNKIQSPFSKSTLQTLVTIAEMARPNECVGLVVQRDRSHWILPLPSDATPTSVSVRADALIQTFYLLDDAQIPIVAAYHSHPSGLAVPSTVDDSFASVAKMHVLLVRCESSFIPVTFAWITDLS